MKYKEYAPHVSLQDHVDDHVWHDQIVQPLSLRPFLEGDSDHAMASAAGDVA